MDDPARSRRLLARRIGWASAQSEDEVRAALESRLNLYSKLMFWSFVTLLVFLNLTYQIYDIAPRYNEIVFGGASVLLALMAFIWRWVLVGRKLTVEGLYRIDLLYAITIGLAFGASAALQYDFRPSGYTSLIFTSFNVFTRALLVPSSARRTAIVSSVTFVPVVAAGVFLGLEYEQDQLPGPAYITGGIVFVVVAVLIAANGSGIIYGLRRQVREAMQLGSYTLVRRIGEGGMGQVYLAHHELLKRETAVKLLPPDRVGADNIDRFEAEVKAMSTLTHPNTVVVFDYGRSLDGVLYYAMEYLDGIDLDQLVRRFGPQAPSRVIRILVQVAGALQEAHDAGITHRDIKPSNIMLCVRGGLPDFAKVLDFGLAKRISDAAPTNGASAQLVIGTPHYIAPEAITGDVVGPPADLYAVGAVGYFLLSGQRVFEADSNMKILVLHASETPRPLSQVCQQRVPPELEAIVMRCLEKSPAKRFATAADLATALEAVPGSSEWNRDEAQRWWRDYRARAPDVATADTPTRTITVDLGHRA
ncbi:MAG TPA: serine/threonine-protein kinase [Kofleriaceae bacterium]|nr:serine/threonine-protein kinase [Kofleriaceae bacterium]